MQPVDNCELSTKKNKKIRYNVYGLSDCGKVRKINQDSILTTYNQHGDLLAIVCDGIAGGNAGEIASSMVCKQFKDAFLEADAFNDVETASIWLRKVIQKINDLLFYFSMCNQNCSGMGTTLTGVLIHKQQIIWFNVGDSRVYCYGKKLTCLTKDHSYYNYLVDKGEYEQAKTIERNYLTNAMGIYNHVIIDMQVVPYKDKGILVCSDGLHGYVCDLEINSILTSNKNIYDKVTTLIQTTNGYGGYDNISVVLIEKGDCHE